MNQSPDDVVITGSGVCCNLGDDLALIRERLRSGSGGPFGLYEPAQRLGGRCQIVGVYAGDLSADVLEVSKAQLRFMGRASRMALRAARAAIAQAKCSVRDAGVFVGSGTGDVEAHEEIATKLAGDAGMRRVSPTVVPRIMASTVSANLATVLEARGPSCTLTAACAGGAYNIVMGALLIQAGAIETAVAGGVECADPHFFAGFDAMAAYNRQDNERPERASRPYAADRAGFVFAEGAGIVVLERRRSAEQRNAKILATLRGFGMSSDGTGEMVRPNSDGGLRAMQAALANAGVAPSAVDYVNTHATSTPVGDVEEVRGLRQLFSERHVAYSSTKGYTGHTISGAGAIEAIFTADMLEHAYLAPSAHATPLEPELTAYPPIVTPTDARAELALSNSFGFGGTNVALVISKA
ncbi:MAG TPA: beta-ketoacyl-[acyl-carrier-protein] synthase family protein [Polyangiaceae bacterium]